MNFQDLLKHIPQRTYDMRDVSKTLPTDGQALVYDASTGLFTPGTVSGGGVETGTTFPATPDQGTMFYKTDIKTLFQYESAWKAIISYGAVTLYVDGTNGSDAVGQGYGSGVDACATLQFAFDLIPPINGGNVTINMTAETYAATSTIGGKAFSGAYSVTINGTKTIISTGTATGGTQGNTTTQGTVTGSGFGSWANKWIRFTSGANDGVSRLIDSNTTTDITIADVWTGTPANGDTFVIEEPGTTATIIIGEGQKGIIKNDINLAYTNGATTVPFQAATKSTINNCSIKFSTGGTLQSLISAESTLNTCYLEKCRWFNNGGLITFARSKAYGGTASKTLYCLFGKIIVGTGTILDGISTATGLIGAHATSCASFSFGAAGPNKVRNYATGLQAETGAVIISTSTIQFSGNTTDKNAISASYGYIN